MESFAKTHRMNPNVNYGLWVILMCQRRFIDGNNHTLLVQTTNSRERCACGGGGYVLLSIQFCCEPKTTLNSSVLEKGKSNAYNQKELRLTLWRQRDLEENPETGPGWVTFVLAKLQPFGL